MIPKDRVFNLLYLLPLILVSITPVSATTIYKCTDSSGRTIVSDTPISCGSGTTTTTTTTTSTSTATTTSSTALITDSVFNASSFWYTPIPSNAPLDVNSANYVTEFLRQKSTYYGTININTYSYSSPVYVVDSSVSALKVGFNNCQHKSWVDPTFLTMMSAVPIPSYAKQSAGTDAEMTIYQPSSDTLWEMWVANKDTGGNWTACWGGKISYASQSSGINQQNYGATGTGLPFIGGQITAEELSRGEIKHAIGIALVDVEASNIYSWPANRSDGMNPTNAPNRIAEGRRFRLDPAVVVDNLSMSKAGKIIAKAAQKYGFVVWDRAGSISIRAQNVYSYTTLGQTDPYPPLYEYKPTYAVLNGFPWDRLQFLPMNYGKP